MFEVGFTELLLISVLALLVLGPEKLPRVASQLGRWVGRARAMARQFREQLEVEANLEEMVNQPTSRRAASRQDKSASAADAAVRSGAAPAAATATPGPGEASAPVTSETVSPDDDPETRHNPGADLDPVDEPPVSTAANPCGAEPIAETRTDTRAHDRGT
jgi:sec-independent protein translocase protein TatB